MASSLTRTRLKSVMLLMRLSRGRRWSTPLSYQSGRGVGSDGLAIVFHRQIGLGVNLLILVQECEAYFTGRARFIRSGIACESIRRTRRNG